MIGVQPLLVGERRARVPDQRIVGRGVAAMDVALDDGRGRVAVIFERQRVAVVEELGRGGGGPLVGLEQAAERIVDQVRLQRAGVIGDRAGRADLRVLFQQPVLDVVFVGIGAVGGEVAVGVVAEARRAGGGILVEPVDRIAAVDAEQAGVGVAVGGLGPDLAGDLRGGVDGAGRGTEVPAYRIDGGREGVRLSFEAANSIPRIIDLARRRRALAALEQGSVVIVGEGVERGRTAY